MWHRNGKVTSKATTLTGSLLFFPPFFESFKFKCDWFFWQDSGDFPNDILLSHTQPFFVNGNITKWFESSQSSLLLLCTSLVFWTTTMDITISQNQYSFPILKFPEIIQCLAEAGIEITEAELKEPNRHKDKVKSIFLSLVSSMSKWCACALHYDNMRLSGQWMLSL